MTVLWFLAFAGCDVSTLVVEPGEAIDPMILATATIEILSGDDQEGTVGEGLAAPLVVLVRDSAAQAIAGVPVAWIFRQGRGSANANANANASAMIRVDTDEQGRAAASWELGTTAGLQWASAEVAVPAPSPASNAAPAPPSSRQNKVEFKARSKPAKASSIVFSQPALTLEVGDTVNFTASVVDRYGNVIPDAVIRFVSSDPSIVTVDGQAAPMTVQVADAMPPADAVREPLTVLVVRED